MLWTIVVILVVLWLLGLLGHVGGGLIHILLGFSRKIIIPECSRRIARSGADGLDLAIQAERIGTI